MRYGSDLLELLDSARSRALAAGHPKVTPFHLLGALLDKPSARETIERAGGSATRLADLVAAELQHVSDPSLVERVVSRLVGHREVVESRSFRRALGAASRHIRRASLAEVGVVDVLAALFADPEPAAVLKTAGLTRLALLRYHCHGVPGFARPEAELPVAVQCDVVIFNDHYTEMASVVRILEKAFDMSSSRAFKTMVRVHTDGEASVGPYPTTEAAQKLNLARELAEASEAPLRLELRATHG